MFTSLLDKAKLIRSNVQTTFLVVLYAFLFVYLLLLSSCEPKRELRVYNWADYIGESTIRDFEQETGITVYYENYSSNEELLAKLRTGAKYDVIVPSDYMVRIMVQEELLDPIDISAELPEYNQSIMEKFHDTGFDPILKSSSTQGHVTQYKYSVPYMWWTTGIAVNTKLVHKKIDSYASLFDRSLGKKITLLNEVRFTVGMALKSLGYSASDTSYLHILEARDLLLQQKSIVLAYVTDVKGMLIAGETALSYAYSGDVFQAQKQNQAIEYVIPKEGTIIGVDNLCIVKGTKNRHEALEFIRFILRPNVAAAITNQTFYATANRGAMDLVKMQIKGNNAVFPDSTQLEQCEFLVDIGKKAKTYEEIWTDIKLK